MAADERIGGQLMQAGVSRRAFLKYCASIASLLALPPHRTAALAEGLRAARKVPVIWLSFQECTGCTESRTRSAAPSLEQLLFGFISLDSHHTLMAASGAAAEASRRDTIKTRHGQYLLIVDGSLPTSPGYSTIAGTSNLDMLRECAHGAAAVIAVGSCASFGGLPAAAPNPTGALGVAALMEQQLVPSRPLINLPGCPPIPVTISGVLAHYLAFNEFPALDELARPLAFYGNTVHQRCSRYHFYQEEKFAERFDDEGARSGWCLYKLGCKGPTTHNACASIKWNDGTSFPIEAGHPCLGCSEPGFWDHGSFYRSLDASIARPDDEQNTAPGLVETGRGIYENACIYCHQPDPRSLHTPAGNVGELLRSGKVFPHRSLNLGDLQLEALQAYLQAIAGPGGTKP